MGLDTPDKPPVFDQTVEDGLELKRRSPQEFYVFCLNMKDMAQGGNSFGLRTAVYSGLDETAFQEILDAVGGNETLSESSNETTQNGSPRFYEEVLERFRAMKKDSAFYAGIFDLVQMAFGGDPGNLRRGFPRWTNDHFKRLIADLDQESALHFDSE